MPPQRKGVVRRRSVEPAAAAAPAERLSLHGLSGMSCYCPVGGAGGALSLYLRRTGRGGGREVLAVAPAPLEDARLRAALSAVGGIERIEYVTLGGDGDGGDGAAGAVGAEAEAGVALHAAVIALADERSARRLFPALRGARERAARARAAGRGEGEEGASSGSGSEAEGSSAAAAPRTGSALVDGLLRAHMAAYAPVEALRADADARAAAVDAAEAAADEAAAAAAAGAAGDGFVVVSSKRKSAGAAAAGGGDGAGGGGGAPKKKKPRLGSSELPDFYRFQTREHKRDQLVSLRNAFEGDKARIAALKDAHTFAPA